MAIESTQVNEICRISRGTSITGDITSISDIRVDGQVEGKLYTNGKLVVGENAYVSGKIACQTCDVWGKISGDIYVQDIINLKAISSLYSPHPSSRNRCWHTVQRHLRDDRRRKVQTTH